MIADGTFTQPRKADTVYEELKRHIITLRLAPGKPLNVLNLMSCFDTGRTPLREAIQRLVREHLAVEIPRRGYYVSELAIGRLNEMITARDVVEPRNAALAARWITADEIQHLRKLVDCGIDEIERDLEVGLYLDLEFHRAVANASRNRYLAEVVDQLNAAMLRYWYLSLSSGLEIAFRNHHDLIDLLEVHDEAAVEEAMHRHVDIFRKRIKHVIGDNPQFGDGSLGDSIDRHSRRP